LDWLGGENRFLELSWIQVWNLGIYNKYLPAPILYIEQLEGIDPMELMPGVLKSLKMSFLKSFKILALPSIPAV